MKAWESFRRWCTKKTNKPLRRLLGIAFCGSVYLMTDSLWATFVSIALWLVLTR